jgi:GxxExxY protein
MNESQGEPQGKPQRHRDTESKSQSEPQSEPQRHGGTEIHKINRVTERIIGCAIEVHRVLGPGLLELMYQSAMCIELDYWNLRYAAEVPIPAYYKGHRLGDYRVDLIVEDLVVVEIKSVDRLHPVFDAQVLTYLRLTGKRVGLLMNFNSRFLRDGIKRLIL